MAVEVLVRNYDAPGGRKRGDIVSVKKSPAQWGLCEGPPKYTILKIEDADITAVTDYYGLYQRHAALLWDATGLPMQTVRSKYTVDLDAIAQEKSGINLAALISACKETIK